MGDSSAVITNDDDRPERSSVEEKKEESITKSALVNDEDSGCNGTVIMDASSCENGSKTSILNRSIWNYLIVILQIVGIGWFLCHPIVSIVTGELKCRGIYLDEANLDFQMLRYDKLQNPYDEVNNKKHDVDDSHSSSSLCEKISSLGVDDIFNNDNISCHSHPNQIDVARLIPHQNQIVPTDALVLFIPLLSDNNRNDNPWNHYFVSLLQHLSTKPWLTKTILIVSPQTATYSMELAVDTFLKAYLGSERTNRSTDQIVTPLPTSYTGHMIRQLLVLDFTTTSNSDYHSQIPVIEILPQGKRGVLPNLDLVFSTSFALSNAEYKTKRTLVTHPFTNHPTFQKFQKNILSALQYLSASTQTDWWSNWAKEFCNMIAFMVSLVVGPFPPHEIALQRGIDSLTIRIQTNDHVKNKVPPIVMNDIENLLRALSGLSERLHHSTTLYLMPSEDKFVSNGEYIYPPILLLLPLLLRVVLLIFRDMKSFRQTNSILFLLVMTIGLSTVLLITNYMFMTETTTTGHRQYNQNSKSSLVMNFVLILSYGIIIWYYHFTPSRKGAEPKRPIEEKKQGIQALACLLVIYSHVPLILGHISLAYPSCLMWNLLLSHSLFGHNLFRPIGIFKVLMTWPGLLATYVFPSFTPYVCLVYAPLHLLLTLLCLL